MEGDGAVLGGVGDFFPVVVAVLSVHCPIPGASGAVSYVVVVNDDFDMFSRGSFLYGLQGDNEGFPLRRPRASVPPVDVSASALSIDGCPPGGPPLGAAPALAPPSVARRMWSLSASLSSSRIH